MAKGKPLAFSPSPNFPFALSPSPNDSTKMSEELEVLKEVVCRLDEAKIPYLISGSVAMNYYAEPRMTRDIDIVVVMDSQLVEKFIEVFKKDFYLDDATVRDEVGRRGMFNLIHNKHIIKIDFILFKSGDYDKQAFSRRRKTTVDGVELSIISPEDLVINKLLWAKDSLSEMQIKDVRNLVGMVKDLDFDYVANWIRQLGLTEIFNKVKS